MLFAAYMFNSFCVNLIVPQTITTSSQVFKIQDTFYTKTTPLNQVKQFSCRRIELWTQMHRFLMLEFEFSCPLLSSRNVCVELIHWQQRRNIQKVTADYWRYNCLEQHSSSGVQKGIGLGGGGRRKRQVAVNPSILYMEIGIQSKK